MIRIRQQSNSHIAGWGNSWLVYELRDPDTRRPRYVGVTFQSTPDPAIALEWRLHAHIYGVRQETSLRAAWVIDLRARGLKPTIHLLESVSHELAARTEQRWIDYLRNRGEELLNQRRSRRMTACPTCGQLVR